MDTLLKNAVSSIRMGVEDYQAMDEFRAVSAVRNISAGVLLLFKEKLRRESPAESDDVLVWSQIRPKRHQDGSVSFVGAGKTTVDVQQIRERFKALGIETDWPRFNEVIKLRNEVEHYSTAASQGRVRELITDALVVMQSFIRDQLDQVPVDLLGEDTWQVFLNVADIYESERKQCQDAIDAIDWQYDEVAQVTPYLRCPDCRSELLRTTAESDQQFPGVIFKCMACGTVAEFSEIAEAAVDDAYGMECHIAVKDGGDPPVTTCFECGNETFLVEAPVCAACGAVPQYDECFICGSSLSAEEQNFGGLCGYHYWVSQKDD